MFEQCLFSASLFASVAMLIWWISRFVLGDSGDEKVRRRLRSAAQPRARSGLDVGAMLLKLGQAAAAPFMPKARERQSALKQKLGYAGLYTATALRAMTGSKVVLLAAGLAGGYLAGTALGQPMLGMSAGALGGYLLPALWLKRQTRLQQRELVRGLPDALDLLVVCVEAGLTIDAAIQRVGLELSLAHPRLARELDMTHMETRIGLSRAEALRNMGRRTGNVPLQTLATMLIQAERFGTSVAQALRVQAQSMRDSRRHAAEEQAAKASVKLTFPVVLFIFPVVLIVLVGPAAIQLMRSALFAD